MREHFTYRTSEHMQWASLTDIQLLFLADFIVSLLPDDKPFGQACKFKNDPSLMLDLKQDVPSTTNNSKKKPILTQSSTHGNNSVNTPAPKHHHKLTQKSFKQNPQIKLNKLWTSFQYDLLHKCVAVRSDM